MRLRSTAWPLFTASEQSALSLEKPSNQSRPSSESKENVGEGMCMALVWGRSGTRQWRLTAEEGADAASPDG